MRSTTRRSGLLHRRNMGLVVDRQRSLAGVNNAGWQKGCFAAMALALNKSSLKQQRDQSTMYRRFLPSLDLKRQQLLSALKAAKAALAEVEQEIERLTETLQSVFPLLGSSVTARVDLSRLVRLQARLLILHINH